MMKLIVSKILRHFVLHSRKRLKDIKLWGIVADPIGGFPVTLKRRKEIDRKEIA
jgi:hypothetical protein